MSIAEAELKRKPKSESKSGMGATHGGRIAKAGCVLASVQLSVGRSDLSHG